MKKKILAGLLLGTSLMFAQVNFGITFGSPPPVRVMRMRPPAPGPGFMWVDGYWYPDGNRYRWHTGYWTRPPYEGAQWVTPRYEGGRFFDGYWRGDRGWLNHDHRWDRDRNHDYRDREDNPGRGRGR